jgi:hypothetical protein
MTGTGYHYSQQMMKDMNYNTATAELAFRLAETNIFRIQEIARLPGRSEDQKTSILLGNGPISQVTILGE